MIGVASLVAEREHGDGMERYFRTQIGQTTDLQAIGLTPRQTREVDGVNIPLDTPVVFTMADAAALEEAVRPIVVVGATVPGVALARADTAQRAVLVAVLATVTVGLAFGLYPALLASRLSPTDAIRHE